MNNKGSIQDMLDNMQQAPAGMQGDLASVWDRLEQKLENVKEKKRGFPFWRIAALLFFAIGTGSLALWVFETKQRGNMDDNKFTTHSPLPETGQTVEDPLENNDAILFTSDVRVKNNKPGKRIMNHEAGQNKNPTETKLDTLLPSETIAAIAQDTLSITRINVQPAKPRLRIVHINELQSSREFQQKEERSQLSRKEAFIRLPDFFPKLGRKVYIDTLVNN